MKVVVLVLCALVAVYAASEFPCTPSEAFQSHVQIGTLDAQNCVLFGESGVIYYDYTNKMLRLDGQGVVGTNEDFETSIWQNYNTKTQYILDRKNNKCVKTKLTNEMNSPNPPKNAEFIENVIVGTQPVQVWLFPRKSEKIDVVVSLAPESCALISYLELNITTGKQFLNENFYNFIPGVPPFIFDMPSICTNAEYASLDMMSEEHKSGHTTATRFSRSVTH